MSNRCRISFLKGRRSSPDQQRTRRRHAFPQHTPILLFPVSSVFEISLRMKNGKGINYRIKKENKNSTSYMFGSQKPTELNMFEVASSWLDSLSPSFSNRFDSGYEAATTRCGSIFNNSFHQEKKKKITVPSFIYFCNSSYFSTTTSSFPCDGRIAAGRRAAEMDLFNKTEKKPTSLKLV